MLSTFKRCSSFSIKYVVSFPMHATFSYLNTRRNL